MKGVVNKGIQELVEQRFGTEVWQRVKSAAGCDEPFFATSEDYPDELTLALIGAISQIADLSPETVQIEFGRFWVTNTGRATYPSLFQIAGKDPRELLRNLNRIHEQVTRSIANASPPHFECEELPDGRLRMHYHSERGLCAVVHGLILGVGDLFGQELRVQETACARQGAACCTMEVTFV